MEKRMENKKDIKKAQKQEIAIIEDKEKTYKACMMASIVACSLAVILMILEGVIGNYTSLYALASVCFMWGSVFGFCRYFLAKKQLTVLMCAIIGALGAITMIVLYILFSAGIL
jgi:pheromone shutdown protein TraB